MAGYAEKLTKFDGDRVAQRGFDTNMPWVERFWMVWLEGLDSSLFTEDFTKIDLVENPLAREAVEYHYRLAESKFSSSPISPRPAWPGQDFANGELAIVQYGFWFSGGLMIWANDAMKPKIGEGRIEIFLQVSTFDEFVTWLTEFLLPGKETKERS